MRWLVVGLFLLACGPANAGDVCQTIAGAVIVANDGTFLGKIESEYSSDSVLNEYGSYGSKYSATSIWNDYGSYGGKYSSQSPFNPYTTTPPVIIQGGQVLGYLTVNRALRGLNPYAMRSCSFY
jgi:hypothetical protein